MTAESITAAGREAAAALMVDSCQVTRGGTRVFDPETGDYTFPAAEVVYTGQCQIQVTSAEVAASPDVEGGGVIIQRITVKLPVDGTVYQLRDTVEVTSSALDPTLDGKRYRIVAGHAKTFATARRLEGVEVVEDD